MYSTKALITAAIFSFTSAAAIAQTDTNTNFQETFTTQPEKHKTTFTVSGYCKGKVTDSSLTGKSGTLKITASTEKR